MPCTVGNATYARDASCEFYRLDASLSSSWIIVESSLRKSDLMQVDICRLAESCLNNVHQAGLLIKSLDEQLASSLLKTCGRLVIIKLEQAMWTYPYVSLMKAKQQSCIKLAAFLAVYTRFIACMHHDIWPRGEIFHIHQYNN